MIPDLNNKTNPLEKTSLIHIMSSKLLLKLDRVRLACWCVLCSTWQCVAKTNLCNQNVSLFFVFGHGVSFQKLQVTEHLKMSFPDHRPNMRVDLLMLALQVHSFLLYLA